MYKTYLFILLMFVATSGFCETKKGVIKDTYRLYQELDIADAISFSAFQEGIEGFYKYQPEGKSIVAMIDFTKPSTEKRLCVVDLEHNRVLFESHVSHGRKSGENYAESFSNVPGSYKSSLGFFRTGGTYIGKNGYSLLLDGLEEGKNDKARERAIVIHGANYADPSVTKSQGRLGRSLGCPALPPQVSRQIIDTIKGGALLYIHGKNKV